MPIHDWSRVERASFHDFHQSWMVFMKQALNGGLLPEGYYAHAERHMGRFESDLLTLAAPTTRESPSNGHATTLSPQGGVAVATRPPKAAKQLTASPSRRSTVAVRVVGTHRLVALVEIASASNKDRAESVTAYVNKAKSALEHRVNVVHLDLLPPTKFTPAGLGGAIWSALEGDDYPFSPDRPLAADSFQSGDVIELYANPMAVGGELPDLPLFLGEERYIELPLASTYLTAFQSIASSDRALLAAK
jgi:Protein of unknown function (DUF4058)